MSSNCENWRMNWQTNGIIWLYYIWDVDVCLLICSTLEVSYLIPIHRVWFPLAISDLCLDLPLLALLAPCLPQNLCPLFFPHSLISIVILLFSFRLLAFSFSFFLFSPISFSMAQFFTLSLLTILIIYFPLAVSLASLLMVTGLRKVDTRLHTFFRT